MCPPVRVGMSLVLLSTRRSCHSEGQGRARVAASPDFSLCRGGVQREWWKEGKNEGNEGAGKLDPRPQLGF